MGNKSNFRSFFTTVGYASHRDKQKINILAYSYAFPHKNDGPIDEFTMQYLFST